MLKDLLQHPKFDKEQDRMIVESRHKAFNDQTVVIMPGNVIAPTMVGQGIRAYNETETWGMLREPGHLRDFDLNYFREYSEFPCGWMLSDVEDLTIDQGGWLYWLFSFNPSGKRTTHGVIFTRRDHMLVRYWVVGPTYKSRDVVVTCLPYLSWRKEDGIRS